MLVSPESHATLEPDQALPTLAPALDGATAEKALIRSLGLSGTTSRLRSVHVLAYKPGRRCLIEYQLETTEHDGHCTKLTILGKIRTKRFGNSGYRQLREIWDAGFSDRSTDGVSVPEPLGTVPDLRMWLQRKVIGTEATRLLESSGQDLAERIAVAVHKVHTAPVVPERRHTIEDELRILEGCLANTARLYPESGAAVGRILDGAIRLAGSLPAPAWCPSHRDFYADQVIVAPDRLFLIDFDLFCVADPALDIGNFIGHVTEQAVRCSGMATALADLERALEDRFVAKAGEAVRCAVRVYTALTLARHVYLCTRSGERRPLLPTLLAVAEERIARTAAEGGHA